jgi:hypothetical protein
MESVPDNSLGKHPGRVERKLAQVKFFFAEVL